MIWLSQVAMPLLLLLASTGLPQAAGETDNGFDSDIGDGNDGGAGGAGNGPGNGGAGAAPLGGGSVDSGSGGLYGQVSDTIGSSSVSALTLAQNSASILLSPSANNRVLTMTKYILSDGITTTSLSDVIAGAFNAITAANPDLTDADILVEALLEVISAMYNIVSYHDYRNFDITAAGRGSLAVSQAIGYAVY